MSSSDKKIDPSGSGVGDLDELFDSNRESVPNDGRQSNQKEHVRRNKKGEPLYKATIYMPEYMYNWFRDYAYHTHQDTYEVFTEAARDYMAKKKKTSPEKLREAGQTDLIS